MRVASSKSSKLVARAEVWILALPYGGLGTGDGLNNSPAGSAHRKRQCSNEEIGPVCKRVPGDVGTPSSSNVRSPPLEAQAPNALMSTCRTLKSPVSVWLSSSVRIEKVREGVKASAYARDLSRSNSILLSNHNPHCRGATQYEELWSITIALRNLPRFRSCDSNPTLGPLQMEDYTSHLAELCREIVLIAQSCDTTSSDATPEDKIYATHIRMESLYLLFVMLEIENSLEKVAPWTSQGFYLGYLPRALEKLKNEIIKFPWPFDSRLQDWTWDSKSEDLGSAMTKARPRLTVVDLILILKHVERGVFNFPTIWPRKVRLSNIDPVLEQFLAQRWAEAYDQAGLPKDHDHISVDVASSSPTGTSKSDGPPTQTNVNPSISACHDEGVTSSQPSPLPEAHRIARIDSNNAVKSRLAPNDWAHTVVLHKEALKFAGGDVPASLDCARSGL